MVKDLLNCGRTVTTDNLYTSPALAVYLSEKRTYLLGTLRHNRKGIPKNFVSQSFQDDCNLATGKPAKFEPRCGFLFSSSFGAHITLVKYEPFAHKKVLLLSTKHHQDLITGNMKGKPEMVCDYNKSKIGVDLCDQMVSNYASGSPTRKWPTRVFYWLVDVATLNA